MRSPIVAPTVFVMVDIRPDHPGGEVLLFGAISLRSFLKMLWSVSNGIEKKDHQRSLELDVAPDPRTVGKIGDNPRQTLTINVSDNAPPDDVVHAHYKGRYYWVHENLWNSTAFMMLNTLFQFTVTEHSDVGIPIIIAK